MDWALQNNYSCVLRIIKQNYFLNKTENSEKLKMEKLGFLIKEEIKKFEKLRYLLKTWNLTQLEAKETRCNKIENQKI